MKLSGIDTPLNTLGHFFTGQEIEDVHIFGGQTPVKRLENLNVCRENEFFSQVLNDQISSI